MSISRKALIRFGALLLASVVGISVVLLCIMGVALAQNGSEQYVLIMYDSSSSAVNAQNDKSTGQRFLNAEVLSSTLNYLEIACPQCHIGWLRFGSVITTSVKVQPVSKWKDEDINRVISESQSLGSEGTLFAAALEQAMKELQSVASKYQHRRIVLISDGNLQGYLGDNRSGSEAESLRKTEIQQVSSKIREENIKLVFVSLYPMSARREQGFEENNAFWITLVYSASANGSFIGPGGFGSADRTIENAVLTDSPAQEVAPQKPFVLIRMVPGCQKALNINIDYTGIVTGEIRNGKATTQLQDVSAISSTVRRLSGRVENPEPGGYTLTVGGSGIINPDSFLEPLKLGIRLDEFREVIPSGDPIRWRATVVDASSNRVIDDSNCVTALTGRLEGVDGIGGVIYKSLVTSRAPDKASVAIFDIVLTNTKELSGTGQVILATEGNDVPAISQSSKVEFYLRPDYRIRNLFIDSPPGINMIVGSTATLTFTADIQDWQLVGSPVKAHLTVMNPLGIALLASAEMSGTRGVYKLPFQMPLDVPGVYSVTAVLDANQDFRGGYASGGESVRMFRVAPLPPEPPDSKWLYALAMVVVGITALAIMAGRRISRSYRCERFYEIRYMQLLREAQAARLKGHSPEDPELQSVLNQMADMVRCMNEQAEQESKYRMRMQGTITSGGQNG